VAEPGIAFALADDPVGVPHPQPWVPSVVGVRRRPAPVLHEEQRQPVTGTREVLVRVQRPQDRVQRNALVEPVDELPEDGLSPHGVVQVVHGPRG